MAADLYARIPMPWARKGPRFISPSYHRIVRGMGGRTRCGMPITRKLTTFQWGALVNAHHPNRPKVCKTCYYMAERGV